ncbi:hypothetical protein FACS1894190_00920 [Spirochaetia bacterium]|nr:hypothetical protein FACS1894190_00920 [Spirochaetia bacterium]
MILYHGGYCAIEKPDLSFCRNRTDFGNGFYLTPIKEQSINWSKRFIKKYEHGIVSIYEFDETVLNSATVLRFESYSREWFDFVVRCRRGKDDSHYDIVTGGVADDRVFPTITLFLSNYINKREAVRRLRFMKPNEQYCLRTQAVMDEYLRYSNNEEVT